MSGKWRPGAERRGVGQKQSFAIPPEQRDPANLNHLSKVNIRSCQGDVLQDVAGVRLERNDSAAVLDTVSERPAPLGLGLVSPF